MDEILISRYVKASVHVYGVIHIQKLIELLNYYEQAIFTRKEIVVSVNKVCAVCNAIEFENMYIFIKGSFTFTTAIKQWKMNEHKPFWIPNKEAFLKFEDEGYYPVEKSHERFFAYLKKEGWDANEQEFRELIMKIQGDVEMKQIMEDFHSLGFMNEQKLKEFGDVLVSVMNTTKRFCNHGFSPLELRNYNDVKNTCT